MKIVSRPTNYAAGAAISPTTLAGTPVLPDGQLVVVTDQPGVRLMVREGGTLQPAVDAGVQRTTEDMIWEVDYATGVSPPDGTAFTSQAEYDAFGTPLKYMQDVIRCKPVFLDHLIKVSVLAGNQYAYPDVGSGLGGFLYTQSSLFASPRVRGINTSLPVQERTPGIFFQGARTDIYTGIVGTLAYNSTDGYVQFTRTSGTWTPGELVGKFAEFTSGGSSGRHAPIVSNDATTAIIQTATSGMGATTLTVWEPATFLVPTAGPGGANAVLGIQLVGQPGPLAWRFQYLDISVTNNTGHAISDYVQMYDSTLRGYCQVLGGGTIQLYYSSLPYTATNTSSGISFLSTPSTSTINTSSMTQSWIWGRAASVATSLVVVQGGRLSMANCRVTPDAACTGAVVQLQQTMGYLSFSGTNTLDGTGLGFGLYVSEGRPTVLRADSCWCNNCSAGMGFLRAEANTYGFRGTNNTLLLDLTNSRVMISNASLTATYTSAKAGVDGNNYTAELSAAGDEVRGRYGSVLTLGQ